MKQLISFLFFWVVGTTAVFAGDDKPITVDKLPVEAKRFIEQYFKGTEVSYAKVDKDWLDKSYEVIFVTGSKVEFDDKGKWKDIECRRSEVPAGIIPGQIVKYVAQYHAGQKIVEIDRDRRDYEIKLENGIELKFDMKFNLIGFDD